MKKILFSAWWCPNDWKNNKGHFVCEKATKKDINKHLKECKLPPLTRVVKIY